MIPEAALADCVDALTTEASRAGNLCYAFVAGSRARGCARADSDIDFFVVLKQNATEQERAIAGEMRRIHQRFGLQFTHCGEILSLATIEAVLASTNALRALVSQGFLESACFKSDCILSAARKFLVVLRMLSEPKVAIRGHHDMLHRHAEPASAFFRFLGDFPDHFQPEPLTWGDGPDRERLRSAWYALEGALSRGVLEETPVGIRLDRWFADRLIRAPNSMISEHTSRALVGDACVCPLSEVETALEPAAAFGMQCIGMSDRPWIRNSRGGSGHDLP